MVFEEARDHTAANLRCVIGGCNLLRCYSAGSCVIIEWQSRGVSISGQSLIVRLIVRPGFHGWNASGALGCPDSALKRAEENILN